MIRRLALLLSALALGAVAAALVPDLSAGIRAVLGVAAPAGEAATGAGHDHSHADADHDRDGHDHGEARHAEDGAEEDPLHLTAAEIDAAGIVVAPVGGGSIGRLVSAPATIVADADRVAHVPAKVAGTVVELRRKLGEAVAAADVLAVIESPEIAEAKSAYLAALRGEQVARSTLEREAALWAKRVTAEQDVLEARAEAEATRIALDLARQKLGALGLEADEVAALARSGGDAAALRRRALRSPIAGRVIERRAALGAPVAADADLFVVADLATVWVEMAIAERDLPHVAEGQGASVTDGAGEAGEGRIVFLSPVIDRETRAARAVVRLDNRDGRWRPGAFVTATVASEPQDVALLVPREAVQTIDGEEVVFVRSVEGFEKRRLRLGRVDARVAEVVSGLAAGERIAVANSFILKAQLGREAAEHGHEH